MNYLVVQGSSINKVIVYCSVCGEEHGWLRAYETGKKGFYKAVCSDCKKLEKKK
jgi:hypothetical protein